MESICWLHLMVVLCLGTFLSVVCQDGADEVTAVYIVTLKETPTSHYYNELRKETNVFRHRIPRKLDRLHRPRLYLSSSISGFGDETCFCRIWYPKLLFCLVFSYEIRELSRFPFTIAVVALVGP